MKNFTYYRPTTPEAAVGLLAPEWGSAELLAGGTDLLDLQKEYIARPDKVVSLNGIKDLTLTAIAIQEDRPAAQPARVKEITIGAGVSLAAIAGHQDLRKAVPALTDAAAQIGGPQIRNMGTLGGNLCQRNRCWYFRDEETLCLLKGGKKCFATDGENRYHAIFTQGHPCVIVSPSTLAPPLIALGASAAVVGPKGKRIVELTKLFQAPKGPGEREHTLAPNEMVVSVTIPQTANLKNASYEVRQKLSSDWPLVQAAVAFHFDGGKAKDVKIVLGHVAPTPVVADEAAKAVEGQAISEATAAKAGQLAAQGAKPLSQNAYKVRLIEVAVKRALLTAAGAKKYWEV